MVTPINDNKNTKDNVTKSTTPKVDSVAKDHGPQKTYGLNQSSGQNKSSSNLDTKSSDMSKSNDSPTKSGDSPIKSGELVSGGGESLEKLIHSGRQLAESYFKSKRTDFEGYSDEMINMIQERLVSAVDKTSRDLSGIVSRFATESTEVLRTNLSKIETRPLVPILAAAVGGIMLGIYLGSSDKVRELKVRKVNELKSAA